MLFRLQQASSIKEKMIKWIVFSLAIAMAMAYPQQPLPPEQYETSPKGQSPLNPNSSLLTLPNPTNGPQSPPANFGSKQTNDDQMSNTEDVDTSSESTRKPRSPSGSALDDLFHELVNGSDGSLASILNGKGLAPILDALTSGNHDSLTKTLKEGKAQNTANSSSDDAANSSETDQTNTNDDHPFLRIISHPLVSNIFETLGNMVPQDSIFKALKDSIEGISGQQDKNAPTEQDKNANSQQDKNANSQQDNTSNSQQDKTSVSDSTSNTEKINTSKADDNNNGLSGIITMIPHLISIAHTLNSTLAPFSEQFSSFFHNDSDTQHPSQEETSPLDMITNFLNNHLASSDGNESETQESEGPGKTHIISHIWRIISDPGEAKPIIKVVSSLVRMVAGPSDEETDSKTSPSMITSTHGSETGTPSAKPDVSTNNVTTQQASDSTGNNAKETTASASDKSQENSSDNHEKGQSDSESSKPSAEDSSRKQPSGQSQDSDKKSVDGKVSELMSSEPESNVAVVAKKADD